MTQEDVLTVLSQVEHPAISYSLIKLGIVTDIKLVENKMSLVFAFPFPNIPIADMLIQSVALPIRKMNLQLEYTIRVMNTRERQLF